MPVTALTPRVWITEGNLGSPWAGTIAVPPVAATGVRARGGANEDPLGVPCAGIHDSLGCSHAASQPKACVGALDGVRGGHARRSPCRWPGHRPADDDDDDDRTDDDDHRGAHDDHHEPAADDDNHCAYHHDDTPDDDDHRGADDDIDDSRVSGEFLDAVGMDRPRDRRRPGDCSRGAAPRSKPTPRKGSRMGTFGTPRSDGSGARARACPDAILRG